MGHRVLTCKSWMIECFQDFMTRGTLCDVTITAGDVSIPCHRLILAANSDYFAAMFTGGMAEQHMETVEIQGVEAGALGMLVDYCYTGEGSEGHLKC